MRIAGILKGIDEEYGPGKRTVVLFQGCSHNCDGCYSPEMGDPLGGTEVDFDYVINEIRSDKESTGITLSGGDPFDQAIEFGQIIETLEYDDELSKKDLWVYTGHTVETIIKMSPILRYINLNNIDYLVDGDYQKDRVNPPKKYVGSNNQRIIDIKHYLDTGEIVEWEQ